MQARIKRDDIIAFKQYASNIVKGDDRLPVLSFLKVEVVGDFCSLIKSNLKSFVIHTCANDSMDCCFLVDENILFNFVELSESEYINFTVSGIKITINDGRHTTVSPTENVNMYPLIENINGVREWSQLSQQVIDCIKICAEIVFDDEISGIRNSVFIGAGAVAASDATVGYWQLFKEELPKLVLRKQVAMNVGKMKACEHSCNESYDLFKCNSTLFGFSKCEVPFFEMVPKFEGAKRDKVSFYLNKSAFVKWNTYCLNSAKSKILSAEFSGKGYRLDLNLVDAKYEFNTNYYLDIVDGNGYFKFNPATMNQILKVLPSEQIYFYAGWNSGVNMNDRYYLTDASQSFMAAIMLIN